MATQQPKKNSSLSTLLWILLLLILGVVGYYAYITYFPADQSPITGSLGDIDVGSLNWDKDLFQRDDYKAMKSPIVLPLETGATGNTNPFIGAK